MSGLNIGVWFCEIKGKRWSYVAGNGEAIGGNNRLQLTDYWGAITDRNVDSNADFQSCLNIVCNILRR